MLFKKTGEEKILGALAIFSKATKELEDGVLLLDIETEKEEMNLAWEEDNLVQKEEKFLQSQVQREQDFKKQHVIEQERCTILQKEKESRCRSIDFARNKANKVINNINKLLN